MNSLSWLIYFAGVSTSITTVGIFLTFVLSFISVVILISYHDRGLKVPKIAYTLPAAALISLSVTTFVPPKDTIYAIAASEMGEEVMKSTIGQKSLKVIEIWIDNQINKQAGGK